MEQHTAGPGRPHPCPPACMETGIDVFVEGVYCSGTKVAHSYLTGVHGVGLVRVRDVCTGPSTKEEGWREILLSGSSDSVRPSRRHRVLLLWWVLNLSYVRRSQLEVGRGSV